jgi:hypothetical protein
LLGTSRESGEARDDEVEAEEMGMRSGKARCGAAGEGGIEDAEDERKGKEDASGSGRCWGRNMVDREKQMNGPLHCFKKNKYR